MQKQCLGFIQVSVVGSFGAEILDKMHKVGIGSGDLLRESLSVFEKESEDFY